MKVEEARIDDIVDELAKVLNDPDKIFDNPHHLVRYEDEPFFGWEMLLCNMTVDQKGKAIEKDRVYYLPMPVYQIPDHRSKLRNAFFMGGRPAVMRYLRKFFKGEMEARCCAIVMGKYNEYVDDQVIHY